MVSAHKKQRQLSFGLKLPERELYSLGRFCVSDQNMIALKAAESFGPSGGTVSLTITGPAKSGKSHLLIGIANGIRPRKHAAYVTVASLVEAGDSGLRRSMMALRKYKMVCMDDLEKGGESRIFFEELFHLYNHLADRGGRLAFAMQKSPASVRFLPKYLSSRLLSGMVINLKKPDDPLRSAILKKVAADRQLSLTSGALQYILERSPRSVADMMEFVRRLDEGLERGAKRIGLHQIRRVLQSKLT